MKRAADAETWRQFLVAKGASNDLAAVWSRHARPNIRLVSEELCDPDSTEIGASKLGGLPDLAAGTEWPTRAAYSYPVDDYLPDSAWTSAPLQFLAQINLADVASVGCDLRLPDKGILQFFYDVEVQPWGFDPLDGIATRVLYADPGERLARTQGPLAAAPASPLKFVPSEGLPGWEWIQQRVREEPGYIHDEFHRGLERFTEDDYEKMSFGGHSFGGWPRLIQAPMERECQLAANGINTSESEDEEDPRVAELEKGAGDWRLLLQLDSDESQRWMWGDLGRIYFWCREGDIAARRFDRVWTVLQCY